MILAVLAVIPLALFLLGWMASCMLVCIACGLILLLCVKGLRRDSTFLQQYRGAAARAFGLGVAGITVGLISLVWFIAPFVSTIEQPEMVLAFSLWACTLLCAACGIVLLRTAKKLHVLTGAGTSYRKRRVACIVCGIVTLVANLPGVALSILLLWAQTVA